jgi:hypothetical protein
MPVHLKHGKTCLMRSNSEQHYVDVPRKEWQTKDWRKLHTRNFIICTVYEYYSSKESNGTVKNRTLDKTKHRREDTIKMGENEDETWTKLPGGFLITRW